MEIDLKVYANKSKMMVLGEEEGLECEIYMDGEQLEQVSEFKYLGYVFDEPITDVAKYHSKVASGRKVAGTIRPLVNAKGLQVDTAA